jgi:hypothetical protein
MATGATLSLITGSVAIWGRHPEVPEAVISTATGGREGAQTLAHFAPRSWRARDGSAVHHEPLVTAQHLTEGAVEVFESPLHKAARGLNEARNAPDCSASQPPACSTRWPTAQPWSAGSSCCDPAAVKSTHAQPHSAARPTPQRRIDHAGR